VERKLLLPVFSHAQIKRLASEVWLVGGGNNREGGGGCARFPELCLLWRGGGGSCGGGEVVLILTLDIVVLWLRLRISRARERLYKR